MKKNVYCEYCDAKVGYKVKNEHIKEIINKIDIEYDGINAYCDVCNNEVFVEEIDDENTKIVNKIYREIIGIISIEDIELVLKKYNIGASVLSKIFNWGEVTIPRYISGQTPSKEYSDQLKNILGNPRQMYKLLEENKSKISQVAYNKCKKATEDILNELCVDIDNELSIDELSEYIVSKVDVTPKALQKLLYFIQGFSLVFNNRPLFYNRAQAWIHGPVYNEIYTKYKSYQYNIIKTNEEVKLSLPEGDKDLVDYVLKFLGCYNGDILEEITHIETPWKSAREGLAENELSTKYIELDSIKDYFNIVQAKYNMITFLDIKDYAVDMFNKVV